MSQVDGLEMKAREEIKRRFLEMQLREEIKQRFEGAMVRHRIKTQKEAAQQIGVNPATFSLYIKKEVTPSAFVLLKACKRWNLRVVHDGVEFTARQLSKKEHSRRKSPEQLPLFSALKGLVDDNLGIRINKKGPDRLDLSLEIKFAS